MMKQFRALSLILALCLVLSVSGCSQSSGEEDSAPSGVAVDVTVVQRGDISSESRLSGKVVSARDVSVFAPFAAEVLSINVKNGDAVEQDDVLFSLDGDDLDRQYQSLLDNYARTSTLLSSQISAARTALAETKTLMAEQVRTAQQNADNTAALFEIGAASQLEADTAATTLTQAKISADSTIRQTELALLQAQTNADSTLSSLEDSIEDMEDLIADGDVKAPISGVVSGLSVTRGGMLSPQAPACVISEVGRHQIAVSVSETAHPFLKAGDMADVTLSARSDASFPAAILSVSPAPNAVSQLYDVRLALSEEMDAGIGMFADVVFHLERHIDAVLVPTEAILNNGEAEYLFIAEENTAKQIIVNTGLVGTGVTEILSGLSGGETLVIKGQSYLRDGDPVRIVGGEESGT